MSQVDYTIEEVNDAALQFAWLATGGCSVSKLAAEVFLNLCDQRKEAPVWRALLNLDGLYSVSIRSLYQDVSV